jgi:DNA polymerase-3 subunit epsilon
MFDRDLVFLDLETTGATAQRDRITEIGLIIVDQGEFVSEWSTLVNPEQHIPGMIQGLTGISNEMVSTAPVFAEIATQLHAILENRTLVAHNARFDYGFLKNEFKRLDLSYNAPVLCTVKLSRKLFPQHAKHNLDSLISRHNIICSARHRALGDAQVLWQLAQQWRVEPGETEVLAASAKLLKTSSVPIGIPDNTYDHIPETAGVYLFYGDNNIPLYVGKSVNLRSRVMSHFSGDHRLNKDMRIASEIKHIDWKETTGELGALIEEARLVKALSPIHNRQLRRASELCAWRWSPENPSQAPILITARDLTAWSLHDLYGLFRSKRTAITALREIASAHQLCHKVLGLEERTGACFAYQIKRCRGACVGAESAEAHGLRLATALSALRVKAWPFPGQIAIRETSEDGQRSTLHIIDHWCHLGTVNDEDALQALIESPPQPQFDLDTYKILNRYLFNGKHSPEIIHLPPTISADY